MSACGRLLKRVEGSLEAGADEGSAEPPVTASAHATLAALAGRSRWGEGSAAPPRAPPRGTATLRATLFTKECARYTSTGEAFAPIGTSVETVAGFTHTRARRSGTAALDAVGAQEAVSGLITESPRSSSCETTTFSYVAISLWVTTRSFACGAGGTPREDLFAAPTEAQINAAGAPRHADEGLDTRTTAPPRRLETNPKRSTGSVKVIQLSTTADNVEMVSAASPDLSSLIEREIACLFKRSIARLINRLAGLKEGRFTLLKIFGDDPPTAQIKRTEERYAPFTISRRGRWWRGTQVL